MLNPFAIQKDILSKVAAIKKVINTIKETVGSKILQKADKYNFEIDEDILNQCTTATAQSNSNSKSYVCKICNKSFNDGRKLGGHVSRAHKQDEESRQYSQSIEQFSYKQKSRMLLKPKKQARKLFFDSYNSEKHHFIDAQSNQEAFVLKNQDYPVKIQQVYYSSGDQQ